MAAGLASLGIMRSRMAARRRAAGHEPIVYNPTQAILALAGSRAALIIGAIIISSGNVLLLRAFPR